MRQLLILNYSFPPVGNAGSLRALKFAKYLARQGWHCTVVTSEEGPSPLPWGEDMDELPGVTVVRTPGRGCIPQPTPGPARRLRRLIYDLRTVPDGQAAWYRPALSAARALLRQRKFDLVLSSSPPATCHLVARQLKAEFGVPWVADLRHLWSCGDHYQPYRAWKEWWLRRMERRVLAEADALVAHSALHRKVLERFHGRRCPAVVAIPPGFDEEEIPHAVPPSPTFTLTYTGSLDGARQDPRLLLRVLGQMRQEGRLEALRVLFFAYGDRQPDLAALAAAHGVQDMVRCEPLLSRRACLQAQRASTALLLLPWEGHRYSAGIEYLKTYEYMGARRPILVVGSADSATAALVAEARVGEVAPTERRLRDILLRWYEAFSKDGAVPYQADAAVIERCRYRARAQQLAALFDTVLGSGSKRRLSGVLRAREIAHNLSIRAVRAAGVVARMLQPVCSRLEYECAMALQPARSGLAVAAAAGDTAQARKLLTDGADVNARTTCGWTALHHAVVRGHADTAAWLLSRGADFQARDYRGRGALDTSFATLDMLHRVRQRHHRLPHAGSAPAQSEAARAWASELNRSGIVRVPGLIDADTLARMRDEFERFVSHLDARLARGEGVYRHYDEEEHYLPDDMAYISNNAFRQSPTLSRFCLHHNLLEAIRTYFAKEVFIQRAMAYRYLPTSVAKGGQFRWHHDMQDKRVKMMVLLTDVGENDQYMAYLQGSHPLFHPHHMFVVNDCSPQYVRRHIGACEIFRAVGQAGDIFLFDTNGAHCGTRRPDSRVRDVYLVEFSTDRACCYGGEVAEEVLQSLPQPNPFERMLAADKIWSRPPRRTTTWADSLPRIGDWL